MTSRERILSVLHGRTPDHVPLTTWCFGLPAPPHLCWEAEGRRRDYWYSLRLEHLHTLPQPWTLEDDFRRVLTWRSLGVDDWLEVSIPWSSHPEVTWEDSRREGDGYPVLTREYQTPAGPLVHAVRQTDPEPPGWVVQPEHVPLIEDFNIPRALQHAVSSADDVARIRHLFAPPDAAAQEWFSARMVQVCAFAREHGVPVQAWSAFGMDGVIWLTGAEAGVLMALDEPEAFSRLVDIVAQTDYARTELALSSPEVDLIVQRGWYSSTDFWSPELFDRYVLPHLRELAALVHARGRKLGYVMTTGVQVLGERLAEAGVDLLYFVDPVQDGVSPDWAAERLSDRMTLVGGANALTVGSGDASRIRAEVFAALDALAATDRFILHPVDALFPDTPWEGVEATIAAWEAWSR